MAEVRQETAGPLPLPFKTNFETEGKGCHLKGFKEERMWSDLCKKGHFGNKRMD